MASTSSPQSLNGIRVLTLNCWGLKAPLSKLRKERLDAIGQHLAQVSSTKDAHGNPIHVICLQEVWVERDYEFIKVQLADFSYSRFFRSGLVGSGLAIYSRFPITESSFFSYALQGSPLNVTGDFYASKGFAVITLDTPFGSLDAFTTHTYAPGGEVTDSSGVPRLAQAWELAKQTRASLDKQRHVILMGDLNSQPFSLYTRLLLEKGGLQDAFAATHAPPPHYTSPEFKHLDETQRLEVQGITCDSPLCTWSAHKLKSKAKDDPVLLQGGKRLDYVLYASPKSNDHALVANSWNVVFRELVPELRASYSDHFAVDASFLFVDKDMGDPVPSPDTLAESSRLVAAYIAENDHYLRWAEYIAGASLFVALGLVVVPPFVPYYVNWLWVLLSVFFSVLFLVAFLGGWLHARWEQAFLYNLSREISASQGF